MFHRSGGETKDCKGCRYWSEMLARCDGGPVLAVCLNQLSTCSGKYVSGSNTCANWRTGQYGAIDEPGFDPSVYEEEPEDILEESGN